MFHRTCSSHHCLSKLYTKLCERRAELRKYYKGGFLFTFEKDPIVAPLCIISFYYIFQLEGDTPGELCKAELMNVDRLEVIVDSFEYVKHLWTKALCPSNDLFFTLYLL